MLRPLLDLGSFRSCSLWSAAKRIRNEDSLHLSPIASEVFGCDAADEILENIKGRSADLVDMLWLPPCAQEEWAR